MPEEVLSLFDNHLIEWMTHLSQGDHLFAQLPPEELQEIYALAYALYGQQHYQEAGYFFRLLIVTQPTEAKYWKAFGSCLQMQKNYEEALNCYMCVYMLKGDLSDPYFYVHTADCYFALKQVELGLKALDTAYLSAKQTNHARILNHVALMREIWSK